MMYSRIIRVEQWDRRHKLTKQYGLRAAIVYEGTEPSGRRWVACDHRLRVKQWANQRLGRLCQQIWIRNTQGKYHWITVNSDSEWYQGYNDQGEYVIAFRDRKLRDWALLL